MQKIFAAALLSLNALCTVANAQERPVVVELFTSQGCSSCPPADAYLHDLAKQPNIFALALHVDYWDYIGWKDSFASPEFTERQRNYARVQQERVVYTPQMMINGVKHLVGTRKSEVANQIKRHSNQSEIVTIQAVAQNGDVRIDLEGKTAGDYVVHLIAYAPLSTVSILRGENAGRTIDYANVVKDWRSLATWNGKSRKSLTVKDGGFEDMIVIVQKKNYGEIVGAAFVN